MKKNLYLGIGGIANALFSIASFVVLGYLYVIIAACNSFAEENGTVGIESKIFEIVLLILNPIMLVSFIASVWSTVSALRGKKAILGLVVLQIVADLLVAGVFVYTATGGGDDIWGSILVAVVAVGLAAVQVVGLVWQKKQQA